MSSLLAFACRGWSERVAVKPRLCHGGRRSCEGEGGGYEAADGQGCVGHRRGKRHRRSRRVALSQEGASVMLTGRRKEPLEAVAARIAKGGGAARVHIGDMTRAEDAARIADAIEKEFGRLDILVNNAGSNIPDRSWKKLTAAGADDSSAPICRPLFMARSRPCRSCASRRTA